MLYMYSELFVFRMGRNLSWAQSEIALERVNILARPCEVRTQNELTGQALRGSNTERVNGPGPARFEHRTS